MEVQKQWVREDGKWQQKDVMQRPALPSRPSASAAPKPPLPKRNVGTVQNPGLPMPVRSPNAPSLPARRPSEVSSTHSRRQSDMILSRRTSSDSVSSAATTETSLSVLSNGSKSDRYTVRAPEYDPSALPALPPKKTKEEKEADARAARFPQHRKSSAQTTPRTAIQSQAKVAPALPTRSNTEDQGAAPEPRRIMPGQLKHTESLPNGLLNGARQLPTVGLQQETLPYMKKEEQSAIEEQPPPLPRRALPPPPAKRSALMQGFGQSNPQLPKRPDSIPESNGTPPPVPLHSRPDLSALQASKPQINDVSTPRAPRTAENCLQCRDFSAPDAHAARFPRESVPNGDLDWLARSLTSPFPSATDKARAIFTWCHHNIAYNVEDFFGGCVKSSTPQSTLATGKAVCEGYASIYVALGLKAGLEVIKIGGACKGYGFTPLQPGEAPPPFKTTHAWNAVKIDGGEWKLVDPCWGAGNVSPGKFNKVFAPQHFNMSNAHFGLSHYPEDTSKMFREDGTVVSWEQYSTMAKDLTGAGVCGNLSAPEGISPYSYKPMANPIVLAEAGPSVRFTFQRICRHWTQEKNGGGQKEYLYVLLADGLQGTDRNSEPFHKGDGIWWLDVPVKDLGKKGQMVSVCAITKWDGRDGRGLTLEEYERKRGRVGLSWSYAARWTVE